MQQAEANAIATDQQQVRQGKETRKRERSNVPEPDIAAVDAKRKRSAQSDQRNKLKNMAMLMFGVAFVEANPVIVCPFKPEALQRGSMSHAPCFRLDLKKPENMRRHFKSISQELSRKTLCGCNCWQREKSCQTGAAYIRSSCPPPESLNGGS
jgi:hypothetical protein